MILTFLAPFLYRDLLPTLLTPMLPTGADNLIRPLLTTFVDIITQAWFFRVRVQAALALALSLPLVVIGLVWLVLYPKTDEMA